PRKRQARRPAGFPTHIVAFLSRCTMCYQGGASGTVFDREATMRALTVTTALLFALATLPASAEQRTTVRTDAEKKVDKEVDDAYGAGTRGLPDKSTKVDPWGHVRPADNEKKPK